MEKVEFQSIIKPTDEQTISSTAFTLQLFKKEEEKKEAAIESAKLRCRICFKEIAPKPLCFGHGGGGGGGGRDKKSDSSNSAEEKFSQGDNNSLLTEQIIDDTEELIGDLDSIMNDEELDFESQSNEKFDPDVIAKLIEKELIIDPKREAMTLTISLQCKPTSLPKRQQVELQKYLNAIINEFHAFKKQHHLSDDCLDITRDEKGNICSLSINLSPRLDLYDAFIQQLANNLLPTPTPDLQANVEHKEENNCTQTPLIMEPSPSTTQEEAHQNDGISPEKTETKDAEEKIINPSPRM
jgi:hypothetical protein